MIPHEDADSGRHAQRALQGALSKPAKLTVPESGVKATKILMTYGESAGIASSYSALGVWVTSGLFRW